MPDRNPTVALDAADLDALSTALAAAEPLPGVLRVIEAIAARRLGCHVFSASTCDVGNCELDRIHSSHPDLYPTGSRKSKRETPWATHVLEQRRVYVGEGTLAMATAFDDQARMESVGVRSIVNVPVVVGDVCLAVLNFGRRDERVSAGEVLLARTLGLVAAGAFVRRA